MDDERLIRLHQRATRRYLRRKARSEAIWTAHVHKYGRQPTLWHNRYERSLALEDEAQLLCLALARLREGHVA